MSFAEEAPASIADRGASPALPGVRWLRAALLAIPLIILNCYWITNSEMKTGVTELTISTLFLGVTFVLFVVTLLNLAARRMLPRMALRQGEMLVIYIMLSISSVVSGVGNYGFFMTFLGNPFWYATNDNKWSRFFPLLPSWFGPRNKSQILKPFYEGESSLFHWQFIKAWAPPVAIWSLFFLVLIWTMLCIAAILRRQWADNEHLTFPVVYLPFEMTRTSGELYHNRLLWMGFAIPMALHSLNTLNSIFPSLPSFPINSLKNLTDIVTERPWTGIDAMPYALHPAGLGMGFLISTDMLFSTWFFYLLFKAIDVLCVAAGWRDPSLGSGGLGAAEFPFWGYQSWGAWTALAGMAFLLGRPHLKRFFNRAWTRQYAPEDEQEAMSPRVAVVGFLLGFASLCWFGSMVGMALWLSVAFLTFYVLIMLALSRIRAEAAVPSTELVWVNPQQALTQLLGTANLSHQELTGMAVFSWFNTDYRASPAPHEFEALKVSGMARMPLRPVVTCILVAAVVAILAASIWDLQLYYVNGAATAKVNSWRIDKGNEPWNDLDHWWNNPRPTDPAAVLALVFGIFVTVILSALRTRWMGFPFHPAAYVLNTSFAMEFFWSDFIAAWLCKTMVLRYGGMGAYRRALPFFLGLILGDFVTGSVWSIVGVILHLDLFRTFAT